MAHKDLCILTFLRDLYKQNYLIGQLNPEIHNLWSNLTKYFIKPTASPFLKPPTWVKENWGTSVTLGYTPATRNWPPIRSQTVKCGKIVEVTPGTPDVKSRPMRCWKGLQLQLMCCAPFRLLSQDFGMKRTEYQRLEDQRGDQSCSWSRT